MFQPSQILLNKAKSGYSNQDAQAKAEQRFLAAWISAQPVLEVIKEMLDSELNKLIMEDEEIPTPEYVLKTIHLKGKRQQVREIRNLLFRDNPIKLGED